LFYFKYYNFFIENINHLIKPSLSFNNILLPLGISFYTFQQISFLVDSFRNELAYPPPPPIRVCCIYFVFSPVGRWPDCSPQRNAATIRRQNKENR
jgi:D-alanyl-lipoteichoic acid acyltransferase DltB (MBOAT superfamily)